MTIKCHTDVTSEALKRQRQKTVLTGCKLLTLTTESVSLDMCNADSEPTYTVEKSYYRTIITTFDFV